MRTRLLAFLTVAFSAAFALLPADAQVLVPSVSFSRALSITPPQRLITDSVSSRLLVLDDFGDVIPEQLIKSRMRSSGARWWEQPLAFIGGAAIAYLVAPKGPNNNNCSEFDPCTDREKFYQTTSIPVGGAIGVLVLNALSPGVDRFQSVAKIREERRLIHEATNRK
jgi:hypothetical protein